MMQIQEIAEETSISDSSSVQKALIKLKGVPEHELEYYLVLRDTLSASSANTRRAITLAQVEANRRAHNRTRWLAIVTTIISGAVGLIGVALGAFLTR